MTTSPTTSPAPRFCTTKSVVFIALFMTVIWLPLLDSFLHLDPTPQQNEKRALVAFPELTPTAEGARQFFIGVEKYYGDHFGFRNWLVRRHNRWKRQWFQESPLPDVMQGQDGWYFFAGSNMIENVTGHTQFDDATLRDWRDLLESRRAWLAERGIAYLFVIPPDKHTVYPEYLPSWIKPAKSPTKLSQFLTYMKANSTVPIVDLRSVLIQSKERERVYQFTDTHWTPEGGFVTYQEVLRALAAQIPGIAPVDTEEFTRTYTTQPGGDLARLLGQDNLVERDMVQLTPRSPLEGVATTTDTEIYPKAWPAMTEPMITVNPHASGTAILFRDSFAGSWQPFLSYHFNRTIYIWDYQWNPALIEREKPQVVIDEMLERFLNFEDPKKLMTEDGLDKRRG